MYIDMKSAVSALREFYSNAEDTEKVIVNCALTAAGADAVGSVIPGLAIPAAIVSCFGAVWAMYVALCNTLGISIQENVLKLLARAALANIAANLASALAIAFVGMFVPGLSIAASAGLVFATVYLAGLIFLNLILGLAKKSSDPFHFSDISVKDMEKAVKDFKLDEDALKSAQNAYKKNK